jgi:23S rRNA (adenine2503-C2)-methyltransferase
MQKKELIGLSESAMEELFLALRERPYRARQLFCALYGERCRDLSRITTFPARLRQRLDDEFQATLPRIEKQFLSSDGTTRYLLRLGDDKEIETVFMPERDRDTICISTQAGCAVDCKFCLTGVLGFQRNLQPGEIIGQVLLLMEQNKLQTAARREEAAAAGRKASASVEERRRLNLVFMGMGEPLLNYANVMEAVRLLSHPEGMALSLAHMTLSTSGIVPGIQKFGEEAIRPRLAISLNATTDELRDRIMPINRKWPIAELLQACREFPLRPRERLTFEYVLLDGVNDTLEDAARLGKLLRKLPAKINLIGLNPGAELPFRTPPDERILRFQQTVIQSGVAAFIRKPRGRDIFAACGQLKLEGAETAVGGRPPGGS